MRPLCKTLSSIILAICCFGLITGCGHVSANYPKETLSQSALPREFRTPEDTKTVLVWNEPDRVHGFLGKWRDTSERAAELWSQAANSGLPVHKEAAKMYDDLSADGLAEASLWTFFAKGVKLPCGTGDFEVKFADGTKVLDEGVLYVEVMDPHNPYRFSRDDRLVLSRDIVGTDNPLRMILFLPKEYLDQRIIGVSYLGKR